LRIVEIDDLWWQTHVVVPRPKMRGRWQEVADAIAHPLFVNRDRDFEDRECLYGTYRPGSSSAHLIKVVVEYDDDGTGAFVTAYPCSRPGASEVRLWTKPA
jgi:hypothetical protein